MWYYIRAGEQQGPFDDQAFDALIGQGRVAPDTMVWNSSMPDWTPLSQARPGRPALALPEATCSLCHSVVGADNLINLAGARVCAACKPLAIQKMREGVSLAGTDTAWRNGERLILQDKAHLPARCIKCNAATTEPPLKRKFYWHHPAYYILLFLHAFMYVLVAMCVRKRASAEVYLCGQHRRKRRTYLIVMWVGLLLAVGLIVAGGIEGRAWLIGAGIIVVIASLVAGFIFTSVLRTARIKGSTVFLTGAGPDFLASLPLWPG